MKKSWKTKWLAALRSGKYKQGQSTLRAVDDKGRKSFCCLGVLCDITSGRSWDHNEFTASENAVWLKGVKLGSGDLTAEGCDKYGITMEEVDMLVELNDNDGASFKKIAKHIEKNL